MIRRAFLTTLLTSKAGLTEDQAKTILEDLEGDFADQEANAALKAVYTAEEALGNDEIFSKVKGRFTAEALNPIDTMLKSFDAKLPADKKADYQKLDTSHKKYKFMLEYFDAQGTVKGDANYEDLKREYDTLKGDVDTNYVKKADYTTLESRAAQAEQRLVRQRLASVAAGKVGDKAKERHFETNFYQDVNELLSNGIGANKAKGTIDFATGRIMRVDSPDQPLMVDGKVVTLDTLADLTIEEYKYQPSSNPAPQGSVIIPANDNPLAAANNSARNRNLELDKD